jgi:hypothetical protein
MNYLFCPKQWFSRPDITVRIIRESSDSFKILLSFEQVQEFNERLIWLTRLQSSILLMILKSIVQYHMNQCRSLWQADWRYRVSDHGFLKCCLLIFLFP